MDDYLAFEGPLKARIEALVAQGVRVRSIAELGEWQSRAQLAPAVFVGYSRDLLDSSAGGANQAWLQEWWAVIAVRNVADTTTGEALRRTAGPLLADVMQGLGGWTPDDSLFRALQRQNSPQTRYYVGYAEFPTLWQTRIVIRGSHRRRSQ